VLSYYPVYLAYFNETLTDRRLAWRRLADSNLDWNQSGYILERWRAEHPRAVVAPAPPRPGLYVVSVNQLVGIVRDERFAPLRSRLPESHVGHAWLAFRLSPADVAELRRAAGLPERSRRTRRSPSDASAPAPAP
jgi:hypothetical protein